MTRSLKKGPFVANHLLKKIENLNLKKERKIIILCIYTNNIN